MSYTQVGYTVTCTIDAPSLEQLVTELFDYCTNHEGEVPEALQDCEDFDDFASVAGGYIELHGSTLTITLDTEGDHNYNNEVFDFLTTHYAHIMTSNFMKVTWSSYDSRCGLSGDTTYYDRESNAIDIESLLNNV
jgi:hypothetical protein